MNARPADTQAGWRIFRNSDYSLTKDEVNERLIALGHRPISDRTYRHYLKLHDYGYRQYLPINRLDVATLLNPLWDEASRSRYLPRAIRERAVVTLLRGGILHTLVGQAVSISEGEIIVRFDGPEGVAFLSRRKNYADQLVDIVLEEHGHQLARVERVNIEASADVATVIFALPTPGAFDLSEDTPLGPMTLKVRLVPEEDVPTLALMTERMYFLFQTVESSRLVGAEVVRQLRPGQEFRLPPPRLQSVSYASPLEVVVHVAAYGSLLLTLAQALARTYSRINEAAATKHTPRRAKAEADAAEWTADIQQSTALRLRVENEQLLAERQLDPSPQVRQFGGDVAAALGVDETQGSNLDINRITEMVTRQLLPNLVRMVGGSVKSVRIEGSDGLVVEISKPEIPASTEEGSSAE